MPHANIWIRRENWEEWQDLPNKAEFVNNALNGKKQEVANYIKNSEMDAIKYGNPPKPLVIPGVVKGSEFVPKAPEKGYPCCQLKKPCKHWQWDTGQVSWVNSITGEMKDE